MHIFVLRHIFTLSEKERTQLLVANCRHGSEYLGEALKDRRQLNFDIALATTTQDWSTKRQGHDEDLSQRNKAWQWPRVMCQKVVSIGAKQKACVPGGIYYGMIIDYGLPVFWIMGKFTLACFPVTHANMNCNSLDDMTKSCKPDDRGQRTKLSTEERLKEPYQHDETLWEKVSKGAGVRVES